MDHREVLVHSMQGAGLLMWFLSAFLLPTVQGRKIFSSHRRKERKKKIYRSLIKVQRISTDKSLRNYLFINNIYLAIADVGMSAFQCFNTESPLMSLQQALSMAADHISGFRTKPLQEPTLLHVDNLRRHQAVGERTSEVL